MGFSRWLIGIKYPFHLVHKTHNKIRPNGNTKLNKYIPAFRTPILPRTKNKQENRMIAALRQPSSFTIANTPAKKTADLKASARRSFIHMSKHAAITAS